MSTLNHSSSNDKNTEMLPSHPNQQSEQSVLLPFSGELSVDDKLKLSNENFKQTIDDFFKHKNITPVSQLTTTPAFPTPHVLAQFASKVYTDYEKREDETQYEERLALPEGWKLLTTASKSGVANGYFGAAYWHPEHQQVVIAHRGTKPSNLGALWADLRGVMHNHYVSQMESASTFAHKLVEVLREVIRKKGVIFQLFYTGHSLGGWLAQITTFTTKYLKIEGNAFLKTNDVHDCYHPHTVVFDSPGCQDMLSKMTDKLDVLYEGSSTDLKHLDITSYLSAPNLINTCNKHVGTVYRIFPDLSHMGWLGKNTALYNKDTHSMHKIVKAFVPLAGQVGKDGKGNLKIQATPIIDKFVKAFDPVTGQVDKDGKGNLKIQATPVIDNFVEAFDPVTGQVHKDGEGNLKIQVVVDWPVNAGLSRSKEYKRFFKWANDINNYHPEVKDQTCPLEGYTQMRYQTKKYDKRVGRLNVFCQQERQFLESYHWLRQLPDFFKPAELFSVIEGNQAQEYAEKILQDFEIENDKIRCTHARTLQAVIPYVKRLLQLFPEMKGTTTSALSSDEIRKRVYQIETRRYVERISQNPFDFKGKDLSLKEFVESSDKQVLQLQMVDGDEWTGIIKVYQILQKTGCLSEGQYTVLNLERLLTVNQLMDFSKLMQPTRNLHLLLVASDTNQLLIDEAQHTIRKFFNTIKDNQYIKIIFLSTRSEGTTPLSLQQIVREVFGNAFVKRDEKLTWSDLTTSSQEKLLEKSVKFQGAKISLNELMSTEYAVAKLLPLGALLVKKELKIAKPVPLSNGYNEFYYIGRTLNRQIAIKQDIFNDRDVKASHVYLARNEQEFKQFCQRNPESNVHWLEKDVSGHLVWQQSQGTLETLRKYIDTESSHTYTADDLDKLLKQAQHQRIMLISDTAGMGKSTVLTHLSKQIKQRFPAKWVVRIDLNDHTDSLNALKQKHIDKKKAIDFVSKNLLNLNRGLEMELFKQCCEQKQKVGIVIMLDGFDEISPFYKETVLALLQALRQTAVEQLWVTTRPHLRNELEDRLQQLSYTLEPFSEENQIKFLTKFWSLRDWITKTDNNEEQENNKKLEICAKELIHKLVRSISDKERELTGIPLQTRMLAEAFQREVKIFCQSPESTPVLLSELDLIALYRKFIESKYDIYQEEKSRVQKTNVIAQGLRERELKIMREDHKLLALKVLFNKETVALLQDNRISMFSDQDLSRIGIAQINHNGKLHFIHRTFAEYYVAGCLVNRLTEGNNTSEQIQKFILNDIFLKKEYRMIRVFIDGLLSSSKPPPNEVLKEYGNRIHDIGEYGVQILHQAAHEGNANIVGFLLDSVQAGQHTHTLNEMLLKQDDEQQTVWHKVALLGNIQVLQELWKWAKKVLTPQELKNELLLATVEYQSPKFSAFSSQQDKKSTALQNAVQEGKTEVFLKLWEWTKEELTTEEIKNEVLLGKDNSKQAVWHMTARNGNIYIVEKIWEWSTEELSAEEVNELLLAKNDSKETAVHVAAKFGQTEVLQKLLEWGKEKLSAEEINELLLAKNDWKETAFHVAARNGKTEVLQKFWEWSTEKLSAEEIKELLLAKDDMKNTLLHAAAWNGKTEMLQKLWEWSTEKLSAEERKELLLAKDKWKRTAFHVAAWHGKTEVLQKFWEWGTEKLSAEEMKELLLAKDHMKETAFHVLARNGKTEMLQKLWDWCNEKLTPEELKSYLLLNRNVIRGST